MITATTWNNSRIPLLLVIQHVEVLFKSELDNYWTMLYKYHYDMNIEDVIYNWLWEIKNHNIQIRSEDTSEESIGFALDLIVLIYAYTDIYY